MIFLGLGSNEGDRVSNLQQALDLISKQVDILNISPLYESPALLPTGAPEQWNEPYINCVVEIKTLIDPGELHRFLQSVERSMGRVGDAPRWSPRNIDIDLLMYNDDMLQTEKLTLPHPEMDKRAFVLLPLFDVAGDMHLPHFNIALRSAIENLGSTAETRKVSTTLAA